MNDNDRERIVSEYIRQAMDIQNGKDNEMPDLTGIARELGMTDDEIAGVARASREHLERGSGYLRHHQWNDAVDELTVASALDPSNADALCQLASAYAGRWGETKNKDDRSEAERLAKRCLELEPGHEAAFALIEQLHAPRASQAAAQGSPAAGSSRVVKPMVAIVIAVMVAIAGITGAIVFTVGNSISSVVNSFPKSFPTSSGKSSAKGRPIPIALAGPAGMTLQLDDSRLYPGESICCVKGDVTPPAGSAGRSGVDLELDMIDSSGNVAESDRFTAWPCSKHPGSFNFHRDNPIVPRIKEARLIAR